MTVKALTHWIIYRGYKVRFRERGAEQVTGLLTGALGEIPFVYRVAKMQVQLPTQWITINEHGWEVRKTAASPDQRPHSPNRKPIDQPQDQESS